MKVIAWNLKNIGDNKLSVLLNPLLAASGFGNNVVDYIASVVMGRPIWGSVLTQTPADIFVMIELKSGGFQKGKPVSQNCLTTLASMTSAMNTVASTRIPANQYAYTAVTPLLTGRHETVGIIFNNKRLTFVGVDVLKDNMNRYLNPRTPMTVTFKENATGADFAVTGIHAPPPGGSAADRSKNPVSYCVKLATLPVLSTASTGFSCITGDFNCNSASVYSLNGTMVYPFVALQPIGYPKAGLKYSVLTSLRKKPDNSKTPPANYLKDAYDNLIFSTPWTPVSSRPDLIGCALAGQANVQLVGVLNNYWKVSDHMPVVAE